MPKPTRVTMDIRKAQEAALDKGKAKPKRRVPFNPNQSKLTPSLVDKVAKYLRNGYTRASTATLVGISPSTFAKWFRLGTDNDFKPEGFVHSQANRARYVDFAFTVEEAEAQAANRMIDVVFKAAEGWKERKTKTVTKTEIVLDKYGREWGEKVETTKTEEEATKFDWRAAEFYLSRRDRANFGDRGATVTAGEDEEDDIDNVRALARIAVDAMRAVTKSKLGDDTVFPTESE